MPTHLTRRTVLTTALGTAALGLVAAARPATAAPLTTASRGRFVDVTGWPVSARVNAFAVGASGTWAIGQHYDSSRDHSAAILRRRAGTTGTTWAAVALPTTFRATGTAAYADSSGVWVAGTRNDVSLPVADGSSVVGHVSTAGTWRSFGTLGLPKWLNVASVRAEGGQLLLTGMVPTSGGASLRPYAASRAIDSPATVRWTSELVTAPAWDTSSAFPLLRIADGAPTWATAGAWVLRRQGSGWTVVDVPPGTTGSTKIACASAQGQIHVLTQGYAGLGLWRRTDTAGSAAWVSVPLPDKFVAQAMAGDAEQLWVVGETDGGEDFAATALRVVGGKVVDRVGGPLSAGGPVGILNQVIVDPGGVLAAGYRSTQPGGLGLGWTCRPVV